MIAGTTWSGAHDRAARRLTKLYPWLTYLKDEEVMPEKSVPVARDMIAEGANVIVGNAEFMALPLKDIADENPDVYFIGIIASDLSTKRNFLRYFPRQYQAMYLEGLVAGALTKKNKIGIVSGPICVQNARWRTEKETPRRAGIPLSLRTERSSTSRICLPFFTFTLFTLKATSLPTMLLAKLRIVASFVLSARANGSLLKKT